jgi:pentatricopeptide repeat protein
MVFQLQSAINLHATKVSYVGHGDVVSQTAILTGYAQNGRIEDARELFDKMPERNLVTWNAMITAYTKCGRIEDARNLFDRMPERNVASWTVMITAYARMGRIEDARQMFEGMPSRNVVTWNSMIAGYVQNERLEDAAELFNKMARRNVVSWTTMISGYSRYGQIEAAEKLFSEIPNRDVVSWNSMIAAYVQCQRMDDAHQLFDKMPERNVVSWTTIVSGYAQIGKLGDAQTLFNKMPERNVVSWTAMIVGYTNIGHVEKALQLMSQMQMAGIKPNVLTYTSVLSACASFAALAQGLQLQTHVIKMAFASDVFVGSALVSLYSKCGSIAMARSIFDRMLERNLVSWNTMITGYAQHGYGNEALSLFEKMQQVGLKPDAITFTGVISACSHAGLLDKGRHYFYSMKEAHHITPKAEHYACMVDLLGRAGCLDDAKDIIHRMPIEPDAVIWGALLGACRIHVNVEIGKYAAEQLFKLEPQNDAPYLLLVNIYAASGKWADVAKLRKIMQDNQIRKEPGCSWIEVKSKVHIFLTGDG